MGEVERWLDDLGLRHYANAFAENEIGFQVLAKLNGDDLREMNIPLGPRKVLLEAIDALKADGGGSVAAHAQPAADELASARQVAPADAERRQLTVMFCDMVGSTALSTRVDPEDYREIVRGYQDTCAGIVARFGGYVAQFMGDGVLAYFGWPRAHEDDAARAIIAALELVDAVGGLSGPTEETRPCAVRIGIATGPVVVGDIVGEGGAQEAAATGETLNLASRLQALADVNAVVISAETHALAAGRFDYEALGPRTLKGIDGETEVWRVLGERRVESRFAAAHGGELTPLIGRDEEMELLLRRWQRAKTGDGQVVLLAGEPGIGKSRLVRALRDAIGDEPHTRLIYQCSPQHTSSALYPIVGQLEHAAGIEVAEGTDAKLDKLGGLLARAGRPTDDAMPLIASLLSIPVSERYPLPELTPQQLKDRTLTALVDQLVGLAEQQPVLFVLEDAHWIDPTSLELLGLVTERIKALPVLAIVTYRPEFTAAWIGLSHVTLQALNRLDARECAAMAAQLAGEHTLPAELMEQLVAKTDGVPLFIEELTRSVLDTRGGLGPIEVAAPTGPALGLVIPATLQEALSARLDRSPAVREVAQIGAAIGREFPYDLLKRVASLPPEDLDAALDDLVGSGLIFARGEVPDASYTFKHALVQDTAYDSMVRSKRRETHRRVAEELLALRPQAAETEPAVLARHTTEAGMLEKAIDWWTRAGKAAAARSANPEAVELLERGLALIARLPESEEGDRRELALQTALFGPLIAVKGQFSTEMQAAFNRTLELCERVDAPQEMFRALFAKSLSLALRGQITPLHEVAEDLLRRAQQASDEGAMLMGYRMVAMSSHFLGNTVDSQKHADNVLSTYDRDRHGHVMLTYGQDPAILTAGYSALTQWLLGWPDKARDIADRTATEGLNVEHVSTLAPTLSLLVIACAWSRDVDGLRRNLRHYETVISQYKMPMQDAVRRIMSPISHCITEPTHQAATELRSALTHLASLTPHCINVPSWWGKFLAESYLAIGELEMALEASETGFRYADEQNERWSDPELLRVRGEALAMRDGVDGNDEAESFLRRAIDDARSRSAKSFELRAAMALARFLRDQGRAAEARETLAPIYGWFTEGFGTPDLIDARALLDELG